MRVWSLTGATAEVVVGSPLPADLPSGHSGYDLVGSADTVEVSATEQWSVAISPAAITELGTGAATVTVDAGEHLSSESHPFVLEIGGTAEAGADYTVTDSRGNELSSPYSMTLPGGSRSVTTTVTAVDDTIEESGETIEVTLRLRGSFVARQTITITDDDAGRPAQVTITVPDETLEEGCGGGVHADAQRVGHGGVDGERGGGWRGGLRAGWGFGDEDGDVRSGRGHRDDDGGDHRRRPQGTRQHDNGDGRLRGRLHGPRDAGLRQRRGDRQQLAVDGHGAVAGSVGYGTGGFPVQRVRADPGREQTGY